MVFCFVAKMLTSFLLYGVTMGSQYRPNTDKLPHAKRYNQTSLSSISVTSASSSFFIVINKSDLPFGQQFSVTTQEALQTAEETGITIPTSLPPGTTAELDEISTAGISGHGITPTNNLSPISTSKLATISEISASPARPSTSNKISTDFPSAIRETPFVSMNMASVSSATGPISSVTPITITSFVVGGETQNTPITEVPNHVSLTKALQSPRVSEASMALQVSPGSNLPHSWMSSLISTTALPTIISGSTVPTSSLPTISSPTVAASLVPNTSIRPPIAITSKSPKAISISIASLIPTPSPSTIVTVASNSEPQKIQRNDFVLNLGLFVALFWL